MGTLIAVRLLSTIPVMFGVVAAVFIALRILPGDPVDIMATDMAMSAEDMQRLRDQYGFDDPIPVQFVDYLLEIVRGDLGPIRLQQSAGHRSAPDAAAGDDPARARGDARLHPDRRAARRPGRAVPPELDRPPLDAPVARRRLDAQLLARHPADLAPWRPPRMVSDRGQQQRPAPCLACRHPRLLIGRRGRPPDPIEHDRGDGAGPRPHRPGQGPARAQRRHPSRVCGTRSSPPSRSSASRPGNSSAAR